MFLFSGSRERFSNSVVPSEDSSSESDNPSTESPKIFVPTDVEEIREEATDEANGSRAKDDEAFVSFKVFIPGFQNISKDTHAVISLISYRWILELDLKLDSNLLSRHLDLRQTHDLVLLQ